MGSAPSITAKHPSMHLVRAASQRALLCGIGLKMSQATCELLGARHNPEHIL